MTQNTQTDATVINDDGVELNAYSGDGYVNTDAPLPYKETWGTVEPSEEEIEAMKVDYTNGVSVRDIANKSIYSRGTIKLCVGNTEAYL